MEKQDKDREATPLNASHKRIAFEFILEIDLNMVHWFKDGWMTKKHVYGKQDLIEIKPKMKNIFMRKPS